MDSYPRPARAARSLISVAVLAAVGLGSAYAEEEQPETGTFSVIVENDVFADVDRHYTNGLRLAWLSDQDDVPGRVRSVAARLPLLPDDADLRIEYAVGQNMFTARDITDPMPDEDERPYAGWLYGAVGLVAETGERLDKLELSLGVVGPASLADETQTWWHEVIGADEPRGWGTQLPNEPAIQLTYQRSWRALASGELFGFATDLTPNVGAAVGTVFVYGEAGATVRVGQHLPRDYGPPRIQPSLPGSGFFVTEEDFGWYLFGGVTGRAVAHNVFLDGTLLRDSRSVEKENFVGDLQAGVAATVGDVRLAYTHVLRTREFQTQEETDAFGAISLSVRF